jgi:hypothetical protein
MQVYAMRESRVYVHICRVHVHICRVCVHMYTYMYNCTFRRIACASVEYACTYVEYACIHTHTHTHTRTHTHTYTDMYVHTYIYTYRRTSVAFVYHEYMCMCNVCGVYDCRSTMVIRLNFPLYPTSPIYQYLLLSSKRLLRVRRRRAEYGWR